MNLYEKWMYAKDQLWMAETLRNLYPDDGHYVELWETMRRRERRAWRACNNWRG